LVRVFVVAIVILIGLSLLRNRVGEVSRVILGLVVVGLIITLAFNLDFAQFGFLG